MKIITSKIQNCQKLSHLSRPIIIIGIIIFFLLLEPLGATINNTVEYFIHNRDRDCLFFLSSRLSGMFAIRVKICASCMKSRLINVCSLVLINRPARLINTFVLSLGFNYVYVSSISISMISVFSYFFLPQLSCSPFLVSVIFFHLLLLLFFL